MKIKRAGAMRGRIGFGMLRQRGFIAVHIPGVIVYAHYSWR